MVQYVFLVFLFWFLGSRASQLGCISQLLIPLGKITSEPKQKRGDQLLAGRSMIPLTRVSFPPLSRSVSFFSMVDGSRNSCAQRQFLKPLLKERDIGYLPLSAALGPQNYEKWRLYTPKIWVITAKNEGCGFPWWLVHQISEPSKKLAVGTSEGLRTAKAPPNPKVSFLEAWNHRINNFASLPISWFLDHWMTFHWSYDLSKLYKGSGILSRGDS